MGRKFAFVSLCGAFCYVDWLDQKNHKEVTFAFGRTKMRSHDNRVPFEKKQKELTSSLNASCAFFA